MSDFRVIFRVVPELYEDVFGYLIRVASCNHLGGLEAVLLEVMGVKQSAITYNHLTTLSYYCRLHPEEMAHLSGLSCRMSDGTRAWQVCGEWVMKEPFVATRHAKVCPDCLRDSPFVRGLWTLSFYTACVRHGTVLIDTCPSCHRKIRWNRRTVQYCTCGFDFATAVAPSASRHGLMVAALMELKSNSSVVIQPYPGIRLAEQEHLAALSLDGLCKTLWFLGHCLGELGRYSTGHGRLKPMLADADTIIANSLDIIRDWPTRLGERLYASKQRTVWAGSESLLEKLVGPVHSYFQEEMQGAEFTFVRVAYEQYISNLRRTLGKPNRTRNNDRQLEFDFGFEL